MWGNASPVGPHISKFGSSDMPIVNYSIAQGGWATGFQILTGDPSFASTRITGPTGRSLLIST